MKRSLTFLLFIGLIVGLALSGSAFGQQTLKWAHVYETSETYHKWALWAAEQIAERTDGRYEIDVFPASSLGKETDINEGLSLGTVDIIYTGTAFTGRIHPPMSIAGAPFMFRDFDHWQGFIDSELFDELADEYSQKSGGNKIVDATYYGLRHATSNKPINKPEDMKGLKIRVPNAPLYTMFPRQVGANPTPIAFAEVYLALQQGTVDAQENPLPTIQAKKFYEVQDYINLTGHITENLVIIVGAPLWNRLSDEDKQIFHEVLREASRNNTEDVRQKEAELVSWFEEETDTTINEVDREPFREVVAPAHTGPDAPWSDELYERVQGIQ